MSTARKPRAVRRDLDRYETAPWQVDALVANLPELREAKRILCPCAGDGSIIRRLQQLGIGAEFTTNDINPAAGADYCLDATKAEAWTAHGAWGGLADCRPDWIVENPPFNVEIDILMHAYEAARVGVAFMARVSFAEPTVATQHQGKPTTPRGPWLKAHPYQKRITLERYSFTRNSKTDNTTTDWLVWSKVPLAPPFGVSAYGYRP